MMIYNDCFFYLIHLFIFFIKIQASIKTYKFEQQVGSTIILPSCLSTLSSSSSTNDTAVILFKSDSGELLSINGKLISNNPRLIIKNSHLSELIIKSIDLVDEGQYECRTDQTINYIAHLIVINSTKIHLTVLEGSNVSLHCEEDGMWIIEESHRGGPVRKEYSTELILNNVQRDDNRFQTITCSTRDGHERREYIIDIMYKPTVKLVMSPKRRLMCIICAHPLPYRIDWWWNTQKERDDHIHQTNINQSCIAQQFTFVLEKEYDTEQIIICEAENIYGVSRDNLLLRKATFATTYLKHAIQEAVLPNSNNLMTTAITVNNKSSCCYQQFHLLIISILVTISIIDYDVTIS